MTTARRIVRTPRTEVTEPVTETVRQIAYGVDEKDAAEDVAIILRNAADDPTKPWCTCSSRKHGFGFDPQIGVYLHATPDCWRPSKAYYEASRQAGVLEPVRGSAPEPEPPKSVRRVTRTPRA